MGEIPKSVLEDENFWQEILRMESESEVLEAFRKRGIVLTHDELIKIKKCANELVDKFEKLDDNSLEEIAAGLSWGRKKPEEKPIEKLEDDNGLLPNFIKLAFDSVCSFICGISDSRYDKVCKEIEFNERNIEKSNTLSNIYTGVAMASILALLYRYRKDLKGWLMPHNNKNN